MKIKGFFATNYLMKMRLLKHLVFICGIAIFVFISGSILSNNSAPKIDLNMSEFKNLTINPETGSFVINNPKFYGYDNESRPFYISAHSGEEKTKDVYQLSEVYSDVYLGDKLVSIRAHKADFFKESHNVLLHGNIIMNTDDGMMLEGDTITVNLKTKAASGDQNIRVIAEMGNIYSDKFSIEEGAEEILFFGDSRVRTKLKNDFK